MSALPASHQAVLTFPRYSRESANPSALATDPVRLSKNKRAALCYAESSPALPAQAPCGEGTIAGGCPPLRREQPGQCMVVPGARTLYFRIALAKVPAL